MPKPIDYINDYQGKDKFQLESERSSIIGMFGTQKGVPEARAAAINMVIAGNIPTKEPENDAINVHDDCQIAKCYTHKKTNCERRGIDFLLSFADYKRLRSRKRCYYFGTKLDRSSVTALDSLTIDRIDSTKGYTKDNCVACSNAANSVKNALFESPSREVKMTISQMKRMMARL